MHLQTIQWCISYICVWSLSKLDVPIILGADCVAAVFLQLSEETGEVVPTLNRYGISFHLKKTL